MLKNVKAIRSNELLI